MPTSIDAEFAAFDAERPDVFALFRNYAHQIKAAGFTRYSADALCHKIRWHNRIDKGDRDFALSDHWTSRYARKLIALEPEFAGFFELRVLRSAAR